MIVIHYPPPDFKMKEQNGRRYLFDPVRKLWVVLTEEEWVRQNFVQYLIKELAYPSSLIAIEKEIMLHDLRKRFDVLVYNQQHQPWMMIECKSSSVVLNDDVLQQLLRYHISVPAAILVVTNGNATYAWEKQNGSLQLLQHLPQWNGNK